MKLPRNVLPAQHTLHDFKCSGPVATQDGQFENTRLADLGCFKQDGTDTNKYYHCAVVQSTINNIWYVYAEWGRVGQNKPSFQFYSFSSCDSAVCFYCKQLHKKNDKRGVWVDHPTLGRILQAKAGKDCYLVRPQVVRTTGLPDARNIAQVSKVHVTMTSSNKHDKESLQLLKDLNSGSITYTRANITGGVIPTQETIDVARKILDEATKLNNQLDTLQDSLIRKLHKELTDLTYRLYGKIPKVKALRTAKQTWVLTPYNIASWHQDLDTFESALNAQTYTQTGTLHTDFTLQYIALSSKEGKWLVKWFKNASLNKHRNVSCDICNIWRIDKPSQRHIFQQEQKRIAGTLTKFNQPQPLHQPSQPREDIDDIVTYGRSNTNMLFHGTRSVNVLGILQHGLRLPSTLSNVRTTGAMFGSGLYWADDYKKSAGYVSIPSSYWSRGNGTVANRHGFMFIADVALGKPWTPTGIGRSLRPPTGYHSIFAKGGGRVLNNEFVTFNTKSNYLTYLVEVK